MRRAIAPILVAFMASGAVTSCSMKRGTSIAQVAVDSFHARSNAEQYVTIYLEADKAFRRGTSQDEFVALMEAVRRKLGKYRSSTSAGSHVFVGVGGIEVTLGFDSEFAEGKAAEQFTWRIDGERAALINFTINSPVLVLK